MIKDRSPFSPGQVLPVEYFVGRLSQIQRIERDLRQTELGKPTYLFLTGERGVGKSSLASFSRSIAERNHQLIAAHCHLGEATNVDEFVRVIFQDTLQRVSALSDGSLFEKCKTILERYIDQIDLFGLSIKFKREQPLLDDMRGNFLALLSQLHHAGLEQGRKGLFLVLDDLNGATKDTRLGLFLKSVIDQNATSAKPIPLCLMLVGPRERLDEMTESQPSVGRIFAFVEVPLMSKDECVKYITGAFSSVGHVVDVDAQDVMFRFSGGFPMLFQEIGDAVYWADTDGKIDHRDAISGILEAADRVGHRFIKPLYDEIRSKRYHSILRAIGRLEELPFGEDRRRLRRKDIMQVLDEADKKNFDNFVQRMKHLGVIVPGESAGEYVFESALHLMYLWMQSAAAAVEDKNG